MIVAPLPSVSKAALTRLKQASTQDGFVTAKATDLKSYMDRSEEISRRAWASVAREAGLCR